MNDHGDREDRFHSAFVGGLRENESVLFTQRLTLIHCQRFLGNSNLGFDTLDLLAGARFGRSLASLGDLSGDGSQVLAVGAGANSGGGAVWLLKFETRAIPEPSAWVTLLFGTLGLSTLRRR